MHALSAARLPSSLSATARSLRRFCGCFVFLLCSVCLQASQAWQFVFVSDLHYGLVRESFRGQKQVSASEVNGALVDQLNRVTSARFPSDGGCGAGELVGTAELVVIGGDIANRQESEPVQIQSATESWLQFNQDYFGKLEMMDRKGANTQLAIVPGNHDASNALGFFKPMSPAKDPVVMLSLFNLMMSPAQPLSAETYDYKRDKVCYSRDLPGLHLVFLQLWPDRSMRAWLEADLAKVPAGTPVAIITHDPPDVEGRQLVNPNGAHDINAKDGFENLLSDTYADGANPKSPTVVEQRELAAFLHAHPNIIAYFHGHSNWNEFYDWKGPDGDLSLPVFRVDSPMKGKKSSKDETELSFIVVCVDPASQRLTARECLWNQLGRDVRVAPPLVWGDSRTISLRTDNGDR